MDFVLCGVWQEKQLVAMGRRNKASKNNRRRIQRAKKRQLAKKVKDAQSLEKCTLEGPPPAPSDNHGEDHPSLEESSEESCSSLGVKKHHSHNADGDLDLEVDCLGEDKDVFFMEVDDSITSADSSRYSYQYMWDCRRALMEKVSKYRSIIEKQKTAKVKTALQHRQEIERIRSFYQAMVYAPTRTSKIFKASKCSSNIAREVLDQVGLEYKNSAYYCKPGFCC